MPLIKPTVKSATDGKYQFKHLTLQEHLAGAGSMSTQAAGAPGRSWAAAHEYIRGRQSQPLCEGVVLACLTSGALDVRADALLESCKQAQVGMDETLVLRAITTQCTFPVIGTLNLEGCAWVTDTEVLAWARVGSHVESINVVGCTGLTGRGLRRLFECCREITELHMSSDVVENVPWGRLEELCDGVDKVVVHFAIKKTSGEIPSVEDWSVAQQSGRPWKIVVAKVTIDHQGMFSYRRWARTLCTNP